MTVDQNDFQVYFTLVEQIEVNWRMLSYKLFLQPGYLQPGYLQPFLVRLYNV